MLKESVVQGPEISSGGVVIFPDILNNFPRSLGDKHLLVQEAVHRAYLRQKEVGFYPADMADSEWEEAVNQDPRLARNNTLVRRRWWDRRVSPVSYREGSFGRIFDGIADGLREITREAVGLREEGLIGDQARVLETGFRSGDTDIAMRRFLNLRRHPEYGIWCGFLDRLLDKDKNLKFGLQGWSVKQNERLSHDFNLWSGVVLRGVNRLGHNYFLFADAAIQSGLATERIWQGNTMPSQPDIGESYGHLIYFFDNVSAWKTAQDIEPRLSIVAPEETLDRARRDVVDRSRRAIIAAHEVGHAAQVIPSGADRRLGRWFQVVKEMYADVFSIWSIIRYPEIIISRGQVPLIIYIDLARAHAIIDEHKRGHISADIINPYPYAVSTKINTLLAAGVLFRNSAGIYELGEMTQIRDTLFDYLAKLDNLTFSGSKAEAEDFIMARSSSPVNFLDPQLTD